MTYRYASRATGWYWMDVGHHDPTDHQILDASNVNHITLGDGAGTGEPTKVSVDRGYGYEFDGVDDYISNVPAVTADDDCIAILDGILHIETGIGNVLNMLSTPGEYEGICTFLAVVPHLTATQRQDLRITLCRSGYTVRNPGECEEEAVSLLFNDQTTLTTTDVDVINVSSGSLKIHWGDGSATDVVCDGADHAYSHDYSRTGYYTISVSGDYENVEKLEVANQAHIFGDIASLAALTSLEDLRLGNTSVTYSTCVQPAAWKTAHIQADDCGWTAAMVDQMLIDHDAIDVGGYADDLIIDGTNAPHTDPGAAENARANLVAKGKAVTVN